MIFFIVCSYFAGITATLAGFGSSTILVPVAALFMDVKSAVFLAASFHLFNNIFKVKAFSKEINLRTFFLFGIPSILFAFIGALIISVLPLNAVRTALAVFLIAFCALSFYKPDFSFKSTDFSAIIGGGLSGLLSGLIGLGGAVRSFFLIAFNFPKRVYVGTSALIALVVDVIRVPTYIFTGLVGDNSLYLTIPFLIVSAYLGVRTGRALLDKISQRAFKRGVLLFILVVGIKLLF
jgi:hypothetical protein